jgi:hypothetical protein
MVSERSVAERGGEVIPHFSGVDLKACFTFFTTRAADGSKFPLILVVNGRTERCHKQFDSLECVDEVWHSPSGSTSGIIYRLWELLETTGRERCNVDAAAIT